MSEPVAGDEVAHDAAQASVRPRLSRINIGTLLFLVALCGLGLGLLQGLSVAWDSFPGDRFLGLVTILLAIMMCVPLSRQVIEGASALVRRHEHRSRLGTAWAVGWRICALFALLAAAAHESHALRVDSASAYLSRWGLEDANRIDLQLHLFPLVLMFIMVGVIAAIRPRFWGGAAARRTRASRIAGLMLAVLIGVLLALQLAPTPYLVALALEGVNNARPLSRDLEPGLWARLARAGWEVSVAGCLVVILASVLEYDLSCPDGELPIRERGFWRTLVPRIVIIVLTFSAAVYLVRVTLPNVEPFFAEGLWSTVRPSEAGLIVAGFVAIAAGLVAQAFAGAAGMFGDPRPPLWGHLASALLGLLVLVSLGVTLVSYVGIFGEFSGSNDGLAGAFVKFATRLAVATRTWPPMARVLWSCLHTETTLKLGALLWISAHGCRLLVRRPDPAACAPLDAVAASRTSWVSFLWCWSALALICIVTLPILFLGGIVLYHMRIMSGVLSGTVL